MDKIVLNNKDIGIIIVMMLNTYEKMDEIRLVDLKSLIDKLIEKGQEEAWLYLLEDMKFAIAKKLSKKPK